MSISISKLFKFCARFVAATVDHSINCWIKSDGEVIPVNFDHINEAAKQFIILMKNLLGHNYINKSEENLYYDLKNIWPNNEEKISILDEISTGRTYVDVPTDIMLYGKIKDLRDYLMR